METTAKTARIEDLLAHAEWLRRLAGRLVSPAELDDLVQETWKAAVRSPPKGDPQDARPWLARVLRNLARNRWRTRTRADRVIAAAPPPPAPLSPDVLLERARTERRLADVVLTLEEPYRSTILLRYYEGKSAAEMAAALGIPAGTVRWRLSEAIERLRRKLDEQHGGDRERWRALLLPIAHLPAKGAAGAGALVLATKKAAGLLALLAGATLVILGVAWVLERARMPEAPAGAGVELRVEADRRVKTTFVASGQTPAAGAASVEGLVLDPEGRPIAGARVALSGGAKAADSDRQGKFQLTDVPPGHYVATASDRQWTAAFSSPFVLAPGGRHQIVLRLSGGGQTIEGQIVDVGGGAIPGARVFVERGYPWTKNAGRRYETVADAAGRYRLVLEPREYHVRASAPGYATEELTVALTRPLRRDIQLHAAARAAGQVIDRRSGQPAADALVMLVPAWRSPAGGRIARSDGQGLFFLDDVQPGNYQLYASGDGAVAVGGPLSIAPLQAVDGLVLQLEKGASLGGRITDQQGGGVAGVEVRLRSADVPAAGFRARTRTTSDGGYLLEGLLPGSYRLIVDGGDVGLVGHEQIIQVSSGPPGRLDLKLAAAPLVTGRVVGGDGRAIPGVMVRLERASATSGGPEAEAAVTDDEGRFRVILVASGAMVLTAWEPERGVASLPLDIAPSDRDRHFELRLGRGSSIAGQVRFEDGAPVAGASVAVTRQAGTVIYDSATTGDDGRFEIGSLMPGRYAVRARRKGGPWNEWIDGERPDVKLVEVAANEQKTAVELVVPRGGKRIAGVVQLADGAPAAGSQVIARADDGTSWKPPAEILEHAARVGEDGRFVLEDLDGGNIFILWATRPGLPDVRQAAVAAGRGDVVLRFTAPAGIAGAVRTSDGKPVTDFTIAIAHSPAQGGAAERVREPQAVRAPDGRFSVDGLAAASYELRVSSALGASASRVLTLVAGERKTGVDFVLQSGPR